MVGNQTDCKTRRTPEGIFKIHSPHRRQFRRTENRLNTSLCEALSESDGSRLFSAAASGGAAFLFDEVSGKDWRATTLDVFIATGFSFLSGDTVEDPSSFRAAASELAGNFGQNGVLVDMASSFVGDFVQLLPSNS